VNGRIVGASTEGYRRASACIDNAKRNGFNDAEVDKEAES